MLRGAADTVDELKVRTPNERTVAAAVRTIQAAQKVRPP
jgi:hypothetical protein